MITERQLDVARIALAAAGRKYGAALGGGNALNIHQELIGDSRGIARATQNIDVFVDFPIDRGVNVILTSDFTSHACV